MEKPMERPEEKEERWKKTIEKALTTAQKIIAEGSDGTRAEEEFLSTTVAKELLGTVIHGQQRALKD